VSGKDGAFHSDAFKHRAFHLQFIDLLVLCGRDGMSRDCHGTRHSPHFAPLVFSGPGMKVQTFNRSLSVFRECSPETGV
jgi:hypothetical protein